MYKFFLHTLGAWRHCRERAKCRVFVFRVESVTAKLLLLNGTHKNNAGGEIQISMRVY